MAALLRSGLAFKALRPSTFQTASRHFVRSLASSSGPHPYESFLQGNHAVYADEMYRAWVTDPSSVHASWDAYFRGSSFTPPPGLQTASSLPVPVGPTSSSPTESRLMHLIRAFQVRGHEVANIDPLGLQSPADDAMKELDPLSYGFTEADLSKPVDVSGFPGLSGFLGQGTSMTLSDLVGSLRETYCSSIGVEYMHINSRERCNFIRERFERPNAVREGLTKEERLQVLERLSFSENFEKFLAGKYNTAKRFGVEGCESVIPGFKMLIDQATLMGVESVVIGMPHRGRLNVLANVVRKPMEVIFTEFAGTNIDADEAFARSQEEYTSSGDVKYHLGTSFDRTYPDGRSVHLSLVANPSHLEAVNPVVMGKTRAKQFFSGDVGGTGERVMPVLMHGDAAFAGQGIVYETMHFSNLPSYKTGGTVHIVVNNQIGFTTDNICSRSTRYCTDLGKAFDCPIFHVNADDPEAVAFVFKVAAEWRQTYFSDVIIDIVGYRRYGHNELDQPMFTQPTMYTVINKHETVLSKHQRTVVEEGLCDAEHVHVAGVEAFVKESLDLSFEKSKTLEATGEDWLDSKWEGFKGSQQLSMIRPTGVDPAVLKGIAAKIYDVPEGFKLHRSIDKVITGMRNDVAEGKTIGWGAAEHLAYGSLCLEGFHVRLSGQDVERGTFSHRHAVLHDQNSNELWTPLQTLSEEQAEFHVSNSSLSEFGVLGFELGYSLENPNALVLWEAQFGDFCNGGQIIIDQFLSSGEGKWLRQTGLVMLLPHGYEGNGPEHSSARIERFLQMSDEDPDVVPEMAEEGRMQIQQSNWQVVNCTTPANFFHVLRRQVHRDFRKPLIIVTPKSLLKHRRVQSSIEEFGIGQKFRRLIPEIDQTVLAKDPTKVRKLIFCSGKIYFDLVQGREDNGIDDIAICRIEQITPFPFDKVAAEVARYPNAELVFCQEEPKNMGTWYFCDDRIYTATRAINGDARRCEYIGRKTMASPAVGSGAVHAREQNAIVTAALA